MDLRLSMNQSFVPKVKGVNTHDDRELGLLVYHLYVGEADKLGNVPDGDVVDAGPVTLPAAGRGAGAGAPAPGEAGAGLRRRRRPQSRAEVASAGASRPRQAAVGAAAGPSRPCP